MPPKEEKPYIDTLDPISKSRYLNKISVIGGVDPYDKKATKDWTQNPKQLPNLAYPDIFNYLVNAKSAFTLEQLKSYKSLEAYNQFVCGWVKDVLWSTCTSGNVVIAGKVRHSQRMNDPPLHSWVICQKSGEVLSAHCTCMAGLGEACSHVGALLFWVDSAVKIRDSTTVTQVPAYWMMPSSMKSVPYEEVQDIDFRSAKTMKRTLDANIAGAQCKQKKQSTPIKPAVPPSTSEDLAAFAQVLHKTGDKAVLLSVFPEYCKHYTPTSLGDAYPKVLSELHDEKLEGLPSSEMHEHCNSVFDLIKVTQAQSSNIESETRNQSNCKAWFRFRTGRITASRMKAVCSTSLDNPSRSLICAICYPSSQRFVTSATKWGCAHEADALSAYCRKMEETHDKFTCQRSGFIVNPLWPYMGASPDSVVSCDCCGEGVVEVKCPYCTTNLLGPQDSRSCLENIGDTLRLKKSHQYYFQVQSQIFICKKDYADFVVWTKNTVHIERLEPDDELWNGAVERARCFFKQVVLPELCGKLYTHSTSLHGHGISQQAEQGDATSSSKDLICVCQRACDEVLDNIIRCSNEDCQYVWLHYKCVNLKRVPKGKWYCPECKKLPAFSKCRKVTKNEQ